MIGIFLAIIYVTTMLVVIRALFEVAARIFDSARLKWDLAKMAKKELEEDKTRTWYTLTPDGRWISSGPKNNPRK